MQSGTIFLETKGFSNSAEYDGRKLQIMSILKNGSMFSMIQLLDHSDFPGNKQKILTQYL